MVRLCDELLEQLRNMMRLNSGSGQPELLTCLPAEQPRLEELTRQPSLDTILRQIALLQDCRERMQRNPGKRVELEMALLQLAVPHLAAPVQTARYRLLRRLHRRYSRLCRKRLPPSRQKANLRRRNPSR
ncbi:MAG: hypothetical protein ACLUOF_08865 [Ruminococcus sp.]